LLRIIGVITVLSILFTLLTLSKILPPRAAGILVGLVFAALVLLPKQSDKVLRYSAAAVAVYVITVHLGAGTGLGVLAVFFLMFLAYYMILRPLIPKGKK